MMPLSVDQEKYQAWHRKEQMRTQPSPEQVQKALDLLTSELAVRAPVLSDDFRKLRQRLADAADLQIEQTLGQINEISQEVLKIPFSRLAHREEPTPYAAHEKKPRPQPKQEEESTAFFGREAQVMELQQRLAGHP